MNYLKHPMLKQDKMESRLYQELLVTRAIERGNTLIVAPTALGKTPIALMIALHYLQKQPKKKVLFLAPTKPLVAQHLKFFEEFTNIIELGMMTGETPAQKRKQVWDNCRVVFATPQTVESAIFSGDIDLSEAALVVFDEAHRAVGDYSYVFIADHYYRNAERNGHILALTASPGSTREKIQEVCGNLFIKNIEVRNEQDDDVKPYVHSKYFDWVYLDLPQEYKQIKELIEAEMKESLAVLKSLGMAKNTSIKWYNRKNLLAMQSHLFKIKNKNPAAWKAISHVAALMKLHHAHELIETQGIEQVHDYFEKLWKEDTKASKRMKESMRIQKAKVLTEKAIEQGIQHPKLAKLVELLDGKEQAIVFTHYRTSSKRVAHWLTSHGITAKRFVGQSMKEGERGLRQKEQLELINEFRNGCFKVLVATSLHPKEFVILRNPKKQIIITEIGKFVDSFIKGKGEKTKKIQGWESLTFDGNKNVFRPITQVFRHKRKSKVVKVKLSSGMECLVTEDHSVFTFDENKRIIENPPEKNLFVLAARKVPASQKAFKIDLVRELLENCPKRELRKLYCTIHGMSLSRTRILATELKVLKEINRKEKTPKKIASTSGLDSSTVTDVLKQLSKRKLVEKRVSGKCHKYSLNQKGREYALFLDWFFENAKHNKKNHVASLESIASAPVNPSLFCRVFVETRYDNTKLPRYLPLNSSLAAFLGFYASDNARITKTHANVFLSARKKKMQELIIKNAEKGLLLKPNASTRGVVIDSYLTSLLMKYVFKCGFSARHKEIPYMIFNAPRKEKLAFLEAYFLRKGHSASNKIVFTTANRKLAAGLMLLLRQLGVTKITTKKERYHKVNCYESLPFRKISDTKECNAYYATSPTAFEKPEYFQLFGNKYTRTSSKLKPRIKINQNQEFCFDYIKNITPLKKQPEYVYDIAVEGTEKFFGGIGPICLHNSVGEEGLDIPSVDMVVFYEPVASEIRKIQRAGRTGRHKTGRVVVLVTKDTIDEAYYWASKKKEKNMIEALDEMKNMPLNEKQHTLTEFASNKKITVFVDQRERASGITRELMNNNEIQIKLIQLPVGDFLISERVVIERKSADDFVQSIIDGRLFEQAQALKENFRNPIILIEGNDLYSVRNVHPNAIRGALAALAVDFAIPLIWSTGVEDSAGIIAQFAKREQEEKKQNIRLRGNKHAMTDQEQMEFLVSGLPGVGGVLAKDLLRHFGTVEKVFTADARALKNVEKIGDKKAKEIRRILTRNYDSAQ